MRNAVPLPGIPPWEACGKRAYGPPPGLGGRVLGFPAARLSGGSAGPASDILGCVPWAWGNGCISLSGNGANSSLLGGAAAAWPLTARAQQAPVSFIGLLNGQASTGFLPAFRRGLGETGFDEGRNVAIVYRSAQGEVERLPALAAELVRLRVAVIAAVGGDNSVRSVKAATATIPIVFTSTVG
jgi:hypothetical protein